jgi:hypothetical protein
MGFILFIGFVTTIIGLFESNFIMQGTSKSLMTFLAIIILTSCSGNRAMVDTRLYFGLATDSGIISVDTFQAFMDSVVTPRFPDGLTRYDAQGQWKNGKGMIIREKSVVVEIIHLNSPDAGKKIKEIRDIYKSRFSQESVLLTEERVKASF